MKIITLLRKPLEGSVADNTLKYGCGALNIDATRVGSDGGTKRSEQTPYPKRLDGTEDRSGSWARTGHSSVDICGGRWPANFILTHLEGCKLRGVKTIKENTANGVSSTTIFGGKGARKITHHADENGEAQVADWACVEGCPVREMDRQSGNRKTTWVSTSHKNNRQGDFLGALGHPKDQGYNDEGGASRFFMQYQESSIITDYFLRMITPPLEDACVLVARPGDIDLDKYLKEVGDDELYSTFEPMVHGLILLGEPNEEQAEIILKVLKPGAHVILIPEFIGYKGVIQLEDKGFEVRDAIYLAEEDSGFFYGSKASRSEREAGLEYYVGSPVLNTDGDEDFDNDPNPKRKNIHPTVKPIDVMGWCARDIGSHKLVVDPFLGSGTTGCAMSRLGHDFVGIELQPEYANICEARIRYWCPLGTEIKSEADADKVTTTSSDKRAGEMCALFDF